jgi:TolB-like protein/Flp pilus assembly protein TadD
VKFVFSGQILDAGLRELRRDRELVAVEPQVFDLLLYLLKNRDRVVSKDDLIAGVWGGRVVSDSTLTSRINAARTAIGDSGKNQALLRTIPRKGFRFVGEVTEEAASTPSDRDTGDHGADSPPQLIADRPSIAVLPFENLSDDRGLELIINGLAEDVIALLARVPGFFVIARASSFLYARNAPEVRQIGTELGVRYVVTGSARSSQDRVRITLQLVEAESGNQLWAGRYDADRSNTLDLQDEIARRIITELEPALTKAEFSSVRRKRTASVDAWTHYRQAIGAISVQGWNEGTVAEALGQLKQAVAIDPEFALGRALLALVSGFGASLSLAADIDAAVQTTREEAERAVTIDPNASDVLGLAGCALVDVGDTERGYALLLRALELDPSNAQAHVAFGVTEVRRGRFDEGIKSMKFGMRSSPKDLRLTFWSMLLADGLRRAGRLEEALDVATKACRRDGRLYGARVVAACVLVQLNRTDEARRMLSDARRIRPALSLDEIKRFFGNRAAADASLVWN